MFPFFPFSFFRFSVITQFGLALEEELNVNTSKAPRNLSQRGIFSATVARLSAVVCAPFIHTTLGTGFAAHNRFEKKWVFPSRLIKSLERHEVASKPEEKKPPVSQHSHIGLVKSTSRAHVLASARTKTSTAASATSLHALPKRKTAMNTFKKLGVIFTLSFACQYALAATYYIDSELGDDRWSGKSSARAGGASPEGPWQSLNRLAAAQLSPGDVVELQCGSKWAQTLRLKTSGTTDNRITIRSASSGCAKPPTIDGSQRIDSHAWIRDGETIYNSSWPIQKFQNGSLARGVEGWSSWSASADQTLVYESNCPESSAGCAAFKSSAKPGSIAMSNNFLVEAGLSYTGALTARVPTGAKAKVLVRRGTPPYEPISAVQWITGNDTWQRFSFAFVARYSVPDARLDIEVFSEGIKLYFKDASLKPAFAQPLGAWSGDLPLLPVYHPNRGHNSERPDSVYATVAANADAVRLRYGGTGSTYLEIDPDLRLPQGVVPRPGNRLRIRSAPWLIDEVTITSVLGNRLNFTPETSYPIRKGHGYFLLDAAGTLDSPGEWVYDANNTSVSVWTPEGSDPNSQIRISVLEKGADLSNRSNISLEGINITRTGVGIDLTNARNITVTSNSIANTVREGIIATNASDIKIMTNRFWRTGGDAIASFTSKMLWVEGNDINESAVAISGNSIWSLPTPTRATVQAGSGATIMDNRINHSGGNGIWTLANGSIEKNAVLSSCLLLNDCGGIYVNHASPNTRIASNLVQDVTGNTDGVIDDRAHSVGIYLDDLSTKMRVEDNSVAWAEFGIQIHDSYNNQVSRNTLFGNRQFQILMQEHTRRLRADGDIYGNSVEGNVLVPTKPVISLMKQSSVGETSDFGVFDGNHYSALLSNRIIGQSTSTGLYSELRFEEWQAMAASAREARDGSGKVNKPVGYAATKITGNNIVPNGKPVAGKIGWSTWGQVAPVGELSFQNCDVVGSCIYRSAGASAGLLSSPNFSVKGDVWYRVSFDVKALDIGQTFDILVRRDGWGTNVGYESLLGRSQSFTAGSQWKRYSFSFKAIKSVTAGDPMTGERGARVDFQNIPAGKALYIANLEIVPIAPLETALSLRRISNTSRSDDDISCPDEVSSPDTCANYVRFSDQQPISWPVTLPALGTEIIFTRDPSLVDSDGDGIADSQDKCAHTAEGEITDAAGCALGQA